MDASSGVASVGPSTGRLQRPRGPRERPRDPGRSGQTAPDSPQTEVLAGW